MSTSRLRKLVMSIGTAAAVIGLSPGSAMADEGHWRHGDGRHEAWGHRRGPPVVMVAPSYGYAPAPYVYAPPPVVYVPPVVYTPPPLGLNLILPIRIR
jgi:hypothetical protein